MAPLEYLIMGATVGLGSGVVSHFLSLNIPLSNFAVSSSRASNRLKFEKNGIQFRKVDYDEPSSLFAAFKGGIRNLFFVSSAAFDTQRRVRQHKNVLETAERCYVDHIWYTSLGWGGHDNDSKMDIQLAHLQTEALIKSSGLTYTIIREAAYAEAFPIHVNYYPESSEILLLGDGEIAYASRTELAEANAIMLLSGKYQNQTVLLTGPSAFTLTNMVETINNVTGQNIVVRKVCADEYISKNASTDIGGKPASFFETRVSWFEGVINGDGRTVDPALQDILGRKPKDGIQIVKDLLTEDPRYSWKQSYFK